MYAIYVSEKFINEWILYGIYDDRNLANEIAMEVRDERNCWVSVEAVD